MSGYYFWFELFEERTDEAIELFWAGKPLPEEEEEDGEKKNHDDKSAKGENPARGYQYL